MDGKIAEIRTGIYKDLHEPHREKIDVHSLRFPKFLKKSFKHILKSIKLCYNIYIKQQHT